MNNVHTSVAPSTPAAPTLTYSSGVVTITWTAPSSLNGADLTQYEIDFMNKSSGSYSIITQCDGSSLTVINSLTCNVVMNVFTSSLGYTAGQTIVAKVRAQNSNGWSSFSPDSSSAVIAMTVPTAAPSGLSVVSKTISSVLIQWNLLTANTDIGYDAITRYKVYLNSGSGFVFNAF